jgi:hypothetical protein
VVPGTSTATSAGVRQSLLFVVRRAQVINTILEYTVPGTGTWLFSSTPCARDSLADREVRQNQVSSRSFYMQLIPSGGAWPDLPGKNDDGKDLTKNKWTSCGTGNPIHIQHENIISSSVS